MIHQYFYIVCPECLQILNAHDTFKLLGNVVVEQTNQAKNEINLRTDSDQQLDLCLRQFDVVVPTVVDEVEDLHLDGVEKLHKDDDCDDLALDPEEITILDKVLNHANSVTNVKKVHQVIEILFKLRTFFHYLLL